MVFQRFMNDSYTTAYQSLQTKSSQNLYQPITSSSHVLMRLIEDWKASLDNKKLIETALMDLSKAFNCIPHDLLIAKLHAYGLTTEALTFLYSYLKKKTTGS